MSETKIVTPSGAPPEPRLEDGKCRECSADGKHITATFGGNLVCLKCGHQEKGSK